MMAELLIFVSGGWVDWVIWLNKLGRFGGQNSTSNINCINCVVICWNSWADTRGCIKFIPFIKVLIQKMHSFSA